MAAPHVPAREPAGAPCRLARRVAARAAAVLVGAVLLACGPGEVPSVPSGSSSVAAADAAANPSTPAAAAARALVVGFSQIGAESAWRAAETDSIRAEADRRGHVLRLADAQQRQENQLKALNAFIAQGVDAIVLAPVVETGWEPVLRRARERGIPVVLVDRGVDVTDASLFATLIASDFVAEGRRAGEWLARRLDGQGRIVELQGTPGSAPALDRKRGFAEALASHPGLTLERSQSGDFTRAGGKAVMEAFLAAGPDAIDGVFAHNDDMALGALAAIEEAGLRPGSDLVIVSIDGVREALAAVADGRLGCSVECSPLLGPAAFDAVERAVRGEALPSRILVEDGLFDAGNAAAALPTRAY